MIFNHDGECQGACRRPEHDLIYFKEVLIILKPLEELGVLERQGLGGMQMKQIGSHLKKVIGNGNY